ncbi:MAG: type II toxin-antitoxin system HicA family toxin [Solirubrobacteraceae bacterium]
MSRRLPVAPGDQLVRALERDGWHQVRQRGSHVRLKHPSPERAHRAASPRGQARRAGRNPHPGEPLHRRSAPAALTTSRRYVRSAALLSLLEPASHVLTRRQEAARRVRISAPADTGLP